MQEAPWLLRLSAQQASRAGHVGMRCRGTRFCGSPRAKASVLLRVVSRDLVQCFFSVVCDVRHHHVWEVQ
jgi:hypothetical protein